MKVFASSRLALMASLIVAFVFPCVSGLSSVILSEMILSEIHLSTPPVSLCLSLVLETRCEVRAFSRFSEERSIR